MNELSKEFPNVAKGVSEYITNEGQAKWQFGEALLKDCGPPSDQGIKDGSREKLGRCAGLLKEKYGAVFGNRFLSKLRQTAFMFPPNKRYVKISWAAHQRAGDPETLDEIVETAETEEDVSPQFVTDYLNLGGKRGKNRDKLSKKEKNTLLAVLKFSAKANHAMAIADDMMKWVNLHLEDFSSKNADAVAELAVATANKWTEIANAVRDIKTKRSHLKVVN